MRLYKRGVDFDLMVNINRCYFEADHGRLKLALDRLEDLAEELGPQPKICFTEGMLRKDSLAQGRRAFCCYRDALELDPLYENAAFNAAAYAPDEEGFRRYAAIASGIAPDEAEGLQQQLEFLDENHTPNWQRLLSAPAGKAGDAELGAYIDLALASEDLPKKDKELDFRRKRVKILRDLDLADNHMRESKGESFPADERLALREALEELNRAIELDPYDATFWDNKANWYVFLGKYDEAVAAADEAIKLRLEGFHLPYHNKAIALAKQGKRTEALACAREALAQAEEGGKQDALPALRQFLADLGAPARAVTLEDMLPVMAQVVKAALATADEEINLMKGQIPDQRSNMGEMVALVKQAIYYRRPSPENAMDYVPALAELLSYFTPETLFVALDHMIADDNTAYQNCMIAVLYIAANADEIMQRDALRLEILNLFKLAMPPADAAALRMQYRRAVLEVAAAATDEMTGLDRLMRVELGRIQPELPALIANQEPPDAEGKQRARRSILSKLQGEPSIVDSKDKGTGANGQPASGGCLPIAWIVATVLAIVGALIGNGSKPWNPAVPNWIIGGILGEVVGYWATKWLVSLRKKR